MELFKAYLKEREGAEVITHEHGFITYKFLSDKSCYIMDLYVEPSQRQAGIASEMADMVTDVALLNGCTRLVGSVDLNANGSTISMKALLGYGFHLQNCINQTIYLTKEL